MEIQQLHRTLAFISDFYEGYKVGYEGSEGYRKSTDLAKFSATLRHLQDMGFIDPQQTVFLDLGCADGRVNLLMSYFVNKSIGIEIDPDILAEFHPLREQLFSRLWRGDFSIPPDNITLFHGNSLEQRTFEHIFKEIGIRFADIDLFYTYITLHDLFAEKIAAEARSGALYMVYGFNKVLPRYEGLKVLIPDVGFQGIAALYQKTD